MNELYEGEGLRGWLVRVNNLSICVSIHTSFFFIGRSLQILSMDVFSYLFALHLRS